MNGCAFCNADGDFLIVPQKGSPSFFFEREKKSVYRRPRWHAAIVYVLGFWLLGFSNNAVQGPARALMADLSGDRAEPFYFNVLAESVLVTNTPDKLGLLATIFTVLHKRNITVESAEMHTCRGFAVNKFIISYQGLASTKETAQEDTIGRVPGFVEMLELTHTKKIDHL